MEDQIVKTLLVYGPLGIISLVAMLVAARLYRDTIREREAHQKELAELQERYVVKAETWMEKYHELAKSLHALLESISKRYDRKG